VTSSSNPGGSSNGAMAAKPINVMAARSCISEKRGGAAAEAFVKAASEAI